LIPGGIRSVSFILVTVAAQRFVDKKMDRVEILAKLCVFAANQRLEFTASPRLLPRANSSVRSTPLLHPLPKPNQVATCPNRRRRFEMLVVVDHEIAELDGTGTHVDKRVGCASGAFLVCWVSSDSSGLV